MATRLLPAVERASGMQATRPLYLARRSRPELRAYLTDELRKELPPERARALEEVYSRLGLVPDTLRLEPLMLSLYLEQIAGYYDPTSDTLFVLEGTPEDQLQIVLVHEMTHALQEQAVDLDSLLQSLSGDNDRHTAAQAVVEGEATLTMLEWKLSEMTGRPADLTQLPDISQLLGNGAALTGMAQMPVLARTPTIIRQSLLFPYVGGLGFMQAFWKARPGRPAPFGKDLPSSSEQILHPSTFLASPRDTPVEVKASLRPPEGWEQATTNDLGEFETRVFLQQFLADSSRARPAAAGWGGDRYRLFVRSAAGGGAGAPPATSGSGGEPMRGPTEDVLVWESVWDTPADAGEFTAAVRDAMARRYGSARPPGQPVEQRRVLVVPAKADSSRAVWVLDMPAGEPSAPWLEAAGLRGGGGPGR